MAQEAKKKIIRPGDRLSDKAEKFFSIAADHAAEADRVEGAIRAILHDQQSKHLQRMKLLRKKVRDNSDAVAAQILQYRDKGDIPSMMKRMRNQMFWKSSKVQLTACQAIWFLVAPSPSRAAAVQSARDSLIGHGAIRCLVRVLQLHSDDVAILDPWALGSLAYLTETPVNKSANPDQQQSLNRKYVAVQAMAVNDGALEALVRVLQHPVHQQNEHVIELACWALKSVVGNAAANIRVAFDRGKR